MTVFISYEIKSSKLNERESRETGYLKRLVETVQAVLGAFMNMISTPEVVPGNTSTIK